MNGEGRTRWLRAFRGLAIDLARVVWKPIRFLIVGAAFVCGGVALLVLVGQRSALSRDQLLWTVGILAPSLVVVGLVVVPALRRFSPRETAKDVGTAVVGGSKSLLAWIAVALPIGLFVFGVAWLIDQYRTGDLFLATPLGAGICVSRLQETLTTLGPERDPQVEKCTRQETPGLRAPLFLCFARMLDHGGIYRVAPCSVTCETTGEQAAKFYRDNGLGVDDVCTRSP